MSFSSPLIILKVLYFGIIAYLLVHIFALFGIFLAVGFLLWWFLFPKQTECFLCRIKRDGEWCFFCRKIVSHSSSISPNSFGSALGNFFIIVLLSLTSIGLVYFESKILFKMGFPPTEKTVSFVIPSKGQYRLGEMFPMKIDISGIKKPINAVQADLGFDPAKIEVSDISTDESFANIFIQKEINNELGYARLTGGLPNPGFFSDRGLFATVFFRGISPGVVKVEFLPTSMVLANDGRGTNVLKDLSSVSYLILPERISPEEEKMQEKLEFKSVVLGERSDQKIQMNFYEDKSILGSKIEPEIQKKAPSVFERCLVFALKTLETVDRFILEQVGKVF